MQFGEREVATAGGLSLTSCIDGEALSAVILAAGSDRNRMQVLQAEHGSNGRQIVAASGPLPVSEALGRLAVMILEVANAVQPVALMPDGDDRKPRYHPLKMFQATTPPAPRQRRNVHRASDLISATQGTT